MPPADVVSSVERNVGRFDRTARPVFGPTFAVAGVAMVLEVLPSGLVVGGPPVAVGVILPVTGTVQQCPINQLHGVNTCPTE